MTDTPDTLSNLLTVLADPVKFKQKLHEWEAAVKKHDNAREQSLVAQKQANATLQQVNIRGDQLDALADKLSKVEAELKAKATALALEEKEFRERAARIQHELAARERDVGKRETLAPSIAAMLQAETTAAKNRAGN